MRFRRREENNIGPMKGWAAFFHKIAMFVLFPLRKPLIFFPLLIILYLAPTFRGVKPAEVHLWYWQKIKQYTLAATDFVSEKSKDVLPKDFKITMPSMGEKQPETKGIDKLVDFPSVDVNANRRAIFEKASGAPVQPIDITQTDDYDYNQETEASEDEEETAVVAPAPISDDELAEKVHEAKQKQVKRNLPLIYLDEPKEVIGVTKVHNANELEVDGTYIFLYGIYVNPDTEQGIQAKKFLENIVKNQMVRCSIVAYTFQDIATGMCYIGNQNINQMLVTNKFSKNVAL